MKKRGSGFSLVHCPFFCKGGTPACGGWRISYIVAEAEAEAGFLCNVYISPRDEGQ